MRPYIVGENAYVVLDGELDIFTKVEMAGALPDPRSIRSAVINLTRARYLDSVAIGMLVGFRRNFLASGGDSNDLVLMLPKEGPVRRTFDITGLSKLFSVAYVEPTPLVPEERMVVT